MWEKILSPQAKKAACRIVMKAASAVDAEVPLIDCSEDITAHSFQKVIDVLTPLLQQLPRDQRIYVVDESFGVGLRTLQMIMNWAPKACILGVASTRDRAAGAQAISQQVKEKCEVEKAHPELSYRYSLSEAYLLDSGQGTGGVFAIQAVGVSLSG